MSYSALGFSTFLPLQKRILPATSLRSSALHPARRSALRPTVPRHHYHITMSCIFALDFDGVLCDSVTESSLTAFRAAATMWPDLSVPRDTNGAPPQHLLNAMRLVRPVVETGFENVLLARLAGQVSDVEADFVRPVMEDWGALREQLMQQWGCDKEHLVSTFGQCRDTWIEQDLEGWIGANQMFPQVVDAVNSASGPVYIITTKQTRFCLLLLEKYGVTSVPKENVFGYGTGSKISVLKKIIAMPERNSRDVMFVEDRYETLEAVSISMLGQPLTLHLATWGYNTEKTRAVAAKHPFIGLIDLPQFVSKLQ
eukprot:GFKZ01001172.1.p1 GENE.GFKZ01001172.1~~GFKZ01001172.1.p1  ORF type:complete len:312 (+),score=30.47 GFKZ01001172.1:131-1066(+)